MSETLSIADIPRNELAAWRLISILSIAAIGLTLGGLVYDLYVLATHHLTAGHRAWDIATLFIFGLGVPVATAHYRKASEQGAALQRRLGSN